MIGCPFVLPIYWTLILTEIIIMGFFAMSFNLLMGFTGLLSFGQAGFFGVGAYGVGLILTRGGESLFLAMAAGVLCAAAAALLIGYLCVRRDEIYFAMITLGFGMMLYTIAHNWIELTGGSDGLPLLSVPPLRLFGMELSLFDPVNMYFMVLVICALVAAWSICCKYLPSLLSAGSAYKASSVKPIMDCRTLLKSWAMPPASTPTASIFCDWRSISWSFIFSVMSRTIATNWFFCGLNASTSKCLFNSAA